MNDKLQNRILQEINEKEIKPLPKYLFIIKNILIWIFFIILISLSSILLTFIIALFISLKNENSLQINFFDTFLNSISYIPLPTMIILLLIFLIGILLLKNSTNLYKYTGFTLFILTFIFVIIAGDLMYVVIWNENFKKIEFIKEGQREFKEKVWNRPEKWFFIWKVIVITPFESNYLFYQIILENKNNNLFNLLIPKEELELKKIKVWDEIRVFWKPEFHDNKRFFQIKELKR